MPHQLLCRLAKCAIFYFFDIVKLQFRFCHICVNLLLLSEINCDYVLCLCFMYERKKGRAELPLPEITCLYTGLLSFMKVVLKSVTDFVV